MEQGRQAAPGDPRVWDRASVSVIPEPRLCWAYRVDTGILLFEEQVWAPAPPLEGPCHCHFRPQGARTVPRVQDAPSGCSIGAGSRLDLYAQTAPQCVHSLGSPFRLIPPHGLSCSDETCKD